MAKKKLTKKEAVRRVVATLGMDASPTDIQAEILKRFKIEMKTGHISTTKGELRRDAAKNAAAVEVSCRHQPPRRSRRTKRSSVPCSPWAKRRPGRNSTTSPESFGFDLDLNHVSAAKVTAIRKMATMPESELQAALAPNGKTVLLEDLKKLRELVERVGADYLLTLIGVMTGR